MLFCDACDRGMQYFLKLTLGLFDIYVIYRLAYGLP